MKIIKNTSNSLYSITHVRVRFSETDPLGIVWHGNYIKYFKDGREDFGRKYGISYLDIQQNGYATPIVKSVCEYKKSVRYGQLITIKTIWIPSAVAKLIFQYQIYNEQNELVCSGETIQVFTQLSTGELSLYAPEFYDNWKKSVLK